MRISSEGNADQMTVVNLTGLFVHSFSRPCTLRVSSLEGPMNPSDPRDPIKKGFGITIISFSRSICRGGLAALIGVTGNLIPAVFHAIVTLSAPFGHLPLEGKAAIREYHLLKKRRSRHHISLPHMGNAIKLRKSLAT